MFRSHNLAKLGENNFVFVKKTHQVVIKKQIQIIFRYVCFGVSDFDKNFLVKKCVSVKYLCK